jgi:hypothetical protein
METDFVESMDLIQDKLDETVEEADKYTRHVRSWEEQCPRYIDALNEKMAELHEGRARLCRNASKEVNKRLENQIPVESHAQKSGNAAQRVLYKGLTARARMSARRAKALLNPKKLTDGNRLRPKRYAGHVVYKQVRYLRFAAVLRGAGAKRWHPDFCR